MAYGYKRVSPTQLNTIVDRLSSPTRASISWRYDYDAQATHVSYLKERDPLVHPQKNVNPDQLGNIVDRLTRPTTASTAATWNFDNQDANLLYLRKVDRNIRLPLKTMSPSTDLSALTSRSSSRRSRISVDDLPGGGSMESGMWHVSRSPYPHSENSSHRGSPQRRLLPSRGRHQAKNSGSDDDCEGSSSRPGKMNNFQEMSSASNNMVTVS